MAGLVSAAEGIKAMEEALREIAESRFGTPAWDLRAIAQRALSTWDTRGRLRDDAEFVTMLAKALGHDDADEGEDFCGPYCGDGRNLADFIDTAVLGTRAPIGGET